MLAKIFVVLGAALVMALDCGSSRTPLAQNAPSVGRSFFFNSPINPSITSTSAEIDPIVPSDPLHLDLVADVVGHGC